jgi:Mn-dependent DtxR family transcriptional regulator
MFLYKNIISHAKHSFLTMKAIASLCLADYSSLVSTKRKRAKSHLPGQSDSTEDYLERIAELVDHKGYARVSDVAEELNLTASTVSNMVRRLADRGFLDYEKYRGFNLTAMGRAVAARIKARHETLTELFGLLGLDPATAEQEVEDIEHHLRPQTLELLAKLVNYWKSHPDNLRAFLRFARNGESP